MCPTITGAAGSVSGLISPASCYLVQCPRFDSLTGKIRTWSIVLEMGPGSFGVLRRHTDPRMIDALVLSHTHVDHMGDTISLQVFRRRGPGFDLEPLPSAGPVDTLERIRQTDGTCLPDTYEGKFDTRTVRAGQSYRIGPMTLTPFPGIHMIESLGTHIVGPSDSPPSKIMPMFFTGDTNGAPAIPKGARGVDLPLMEIGFTRVDMVRGIHMDGVRTSRLAARVKVARLVATHIQPWTDLKVVEPELREHWAGPLDFAMSQRAFTVGQ